MDTTNKRYYKDLGIKWAVSLITLVVLLIPTWFWLVIYTVASPTGFWQKFAVLGFGAALLGSLQFVLLGVWIGVMLNVIWE